MDAARQLCRNPHCRLKLKQPEANPRSAFCSRGCHASFYRKRCMACEQPMERKVEHQLLCGRRKCRTDFAALRRHDMLGCYHIPEMSIKPGIEGASETHGRSPTPRTCISSPKTSIKSGIKNALAPDRPWLQVAGPKLTGVGLRLATVGAPIEAADRKAKAAAPVQGDVMPVKGAA